MSAASAVNLWWRDLRRYKYLTTRLQALDLARWPELLRLARHHAPDSPRDQPWVVGNDYVWVDLDAGQLVVNLGYAWDGASGPTWDSPSSMLASLFHDALYQLIREGFLPRSVRQGADEVLRDVAIDEGMWRWRAWAWYYAVRALAPAYGALS